MALQILQTALDRDTEYARYFTMHSRFLRGISDAKEPVCTGVIVSYHHDPEANSEGFKPEQLSRAH